MNLLGHMSLFNRAKIIDQNFTDFVFLKKENVVRENAKFDEEIEKIGK